MAVDEGVRRRDVLKGLGVTGAVAGIAASAAEDDHIARLKVGRQQARPPCRRLVAGRAARRRRRWQMPLCTSAPAPPAAAA